MSKQVRYICYRFFLVPLEEHIFARPAPYQDRIKWFKDAFLENRDYTIRKGVEYAVRVTDVEDSLFFGKLSRKHMYDLHEKAPDDITDTRIENWPYLDFVCDLKEGHQLLVISYSTRIIQTVGAVGTVLTEIASEQLFIHGYSVSFKPIVSDTKFWEFVKKADQIYKLRFDLFSPNLLGASAGATASLKDLQRAFNNTETTVVLKNDKGNLNVPKDPVESYRDYADRGGGSWELVVRRKTEKKKYRSSDNAVKVAVELDTQGDAKKAILQALSKFLELL